MKNILISDPYCMGGLQEYTEAYCDSLNKFDNRLTLLANNASTLKGKKYAVRKIFFRFSESLKHGYYRSLIRGCEYLLLWGMVLFYLIKEKPNSIHFMWFLNLKVDIFFIVLIKRFYPDIRIIFTAHDVVPHNNAIAYMNDLQKIYHLMDKIIVHGKDLKRLLLEKFVNIPEDRIVVTHHGAKKINPDFDRSKIKQQHIQKLRNANKIVLFLGLINENKGVDRLYRAWTQIQRNEADILVIAGRKVSAGKEFEEVESSIVNDKSLLYYPEYLSNDEVNFFFEKSNLVVLPYRNGSVSGVLFNASYFEKPILSTDFGAIQDYIIDNKTGFIVNNSDEMLKNKLQEVMDLSNSDLTEMGINNREFIDHEFSWDKLLNDIYGKCYG